MFRCRFHSDEHAIRQQSIKYVHCAVVYIDNEKTHITVMGKCDSYVKQYVRGATLLHKFALRVIHVTWAVVN